jgi:hypothetical protein
MLLNIPHPALLSQKGINSDSGDIERCHPERTEVYMLMPYTYNN